MGRTHLPGWTLGRGILQETNVAPDDHTCLGSQISTNEEPGAGVIDALEDGSLVVDYIESPRGG